ncbi:excinuclease ABC subunit UvrC [Gammaproteobacteria bacterium]|nr:excinuclease ABC subunit UvrC [Gammaproteobacteria bacterium]
MAVDLKKIPTTPGIYKFFHKSEIIYIGKAINLKKRVSSYFGNSKKDRKTGQIKKLTDQIETFSTKNEVEALLLEQLLIRENKPKFNILLRDDKTYPYIFFSDNHNYPSIGLKRTKKAVDEKYLGPFVSSYAVKKSIKEIQKVFKIRNCSDNTFSSRTRPCIEYQMKRCSAPCVGHITKNQYAEDLIEAKNYLTSSDSQTIKRLEREIELFSNRLEFEKAATARDKLKRINIIQEEQSVTTKAKDIDIFSVAEDSGYLGICTVVVRKGKIRGTKTQLVKKGYYKSINEVYESALINFYNVNPDIPKKILTTDPVSSSSIISKAILKKNNIIVRIISTPSTDIRPIFNLCKSNAKQVIANHLSKEEKYIFALNELKNILGMRDLAKIEAYDISHLYQDHAVASCVVYSKNGPNKDKYRLFNIPKDLAGNDIGSLEHALSRRLKHYADKSNKPDLLLIDGGKTQLKFVESLINNSKYSNIKVISIVKGANRVRATETILSSQGVIEMDKYSKSYLLLQEIRDESHRFAITAQRKKKKQSIKKSFLDDINGIGPVTKNNLLKKYKNIKNIKTAKLEELMTIKGINEKIAKEITSYNN